MAKTKENYIENLTPEQDEKLEFYFQKWVKIGLRSGATTPQDRKMAEEAITEIYVQNKLKTPRIVWVRSPHEAIQMIFDMGDEKIKMSPVSGAGFGQHDANWLGFYEFFREELGLKEETEEIVPLIKLAHYSGWWWPYENVCVVSEIPVKLVLDKAGDLHNTVGPAIEYADGFCAYYLSGISVPDWSIETPVDQIEPKRILELTNTDQRMVLMKHIGLAKFLKDLGAELLDEDDGCRLYYLKVNDQKIGPYLYLKCPSTGREFLEGVGDAEKNEFIDPTIKTCEDAHRWRKLKASNNFMTKLNKIQTFHA